MIAPLSRRCRASAASVPLVLLLKRVRAHATPGAH